MTVRETRPLPIYSPYLPNRPLCSAACCWGARWGWTAEITRIFPLIILCSVEVAVFDGIFGIGWPTPAAGEAKASTIGGETPDGGDPLADQKLEEEQKNLDRRRAQYHHRGGGDEEGEDEPIQGFPLHQIHQHQLQGPSGYAQLERMGDRPQFLLQQQGGRRRPPAAASRGGGEIVEVQGGHIVRSTGRKDRHSKVCTAKGPRDRRVRLSAHTAIQFYDVQDRLGYDRPSKAVDWLMKNAKSAIDKLAELPAWHPTATVNASTSNQPDNDLESPTGPAAEPAVSVAFGFGAGASSSFLPPSLDSDAIANTIKSFFPVAAAATAPTSPQLGYQNYSQDLLSRGSSQDLRLSLHSFHDQAFQQSQHQHHNPAQQSLFSNSAPLEFDSGWGEQSQRMAPWEAGGGSSGGYMVNVPPAVLGHGQFFTQRGPLQSSSSPSVRAWAEPMPPAADHQFQTSFSSTGFESGGIFSGFRIPARIQGEEEQDGVSDKPSSASSASHH